MKCDSCQMRDFVHADLYCQDCEDRPGAKIISGIVYLQQRYGERCIMSADAEGPKDQIYDIAADELLKKLRVEFIKNNDTTKTLLEEYNV